MRGLLVDLALKDQLRRREVLQDRDRKPDNEAGEEAGLQHTLDHETGREAVAKSDDAQRTGQGTPRMKRREDQGEERGGAPPQLSHMQDQSSVAI